MYSLVDLVLLKDRSLKREEVQKILTLTTETIKEKLNEGATISWIDLCTFTWKKKAATKKQAAQWKEFPYLAEGEKLRVIPDDSADGLVVKGGVAKLKRELPDEPDKKIN
jgi:nucleoid DNA-binding protein